MEALAFLLVIAVIPAAIASSKGRSFAAWYVYGVLLWIVALVHSLVIKSDSDALDRRQLERGDARKCPFCAEVVKREAVICRHCQRDLPPLGAAVPPQPSQRTFLDPRGVERRMRNAPPPPPPVE